MTHRVAYELAYGHPANHVLHRCDNPPCGNPLHLYDGTDRDNAGDRRDRGRGNTPRGEASGQATLTTEKVIRIKEMLATGRWNYRQIAETVGATRAQVYQIRTGKTWAHVVLNPDPGPRISG